MSHCSQESDDVWSLLKKEAKKRQKGRAVLESRRRLGRKAKVRNGAVTCFPVNGTVRERAWPHSKRASKTQPPAKGNEIKSQPLKESTAPDHFFIFFPPHKPFPLFFFQFNQKNLIKTFTSVHREREKNERDERERF